MTVKKAIAIGLLTTATLGLAIFGIKKGILKKPVTQTNAETLNILYDHNFSKTIETNTNTQTTFEGNIKYKEIYTTEQKYKIEYTFTSITYNFTDIDSRYNVRSINFPFTIATEEYYEPTNRLQLNIVNQYVNRNVDFITIINITFQTIYLQNTTEPTKQLATNGQVNSQYEPYLTNENTINLIDEDIQEYLTNYQQGYTDGYAQGYQDAENTISPNVTPNQNYTLNTINYNDTNNKIYFTATGQINTQTPIITNTTDTFSLNANVNITVTQKNFENANNIAIDGYQLDINIDVNKLKNLTTDIEITNQNHRTSQATIYSESIPTGIQIQLVSIQTTQINFSANITNEDKLFVNQTFYTPLNQIITTESTVTPTRLTILTDYNINNEIQTLQTLITNEKTESYQEGILQGNNTTEIIPIADTMLQILTMPFTFISQAFNVTLWPGTQYAFNFSNFIKGLLAISAILFIIKVFTSGFAVFGQYNSHRNSNMKTNKPQKANKPTKTKE